MDVPEPIKDFPVHETLKVLDGITLTKSANWWSAVVLIKRGQNLFICFYLWHKKGDKWKRKHKWQIRNREEWMRIKEVVEIFLDRLDQ